MSVIKFRKAVSKCLIVSLVFPTSVFGVGNLLIAPFPDLCLLVPFFRSILCDCHYLASYELLSISYLKSLVTHTIEHN